MEDKIIYQGGSGEIVEKKSRFIADVFPVASEEEALQFLEKVRKEYWDARHHCWAYVIAGDSVSERFSDDGEPGGTAGKPILEVIRGSELHNVLIVVTRYFGGTLLGTGGLVRAYTQAAQAGLAASKIITRVEGFKLKIRTDYTGLGKIQYFLGQRGITVVDSNYTDNVELFVLISKTEAEKLEKDITEVSSGQAETERVQTCCFAEGIGIIG